MSKPELEQGLQGLLSLAVNVDWTKIDKNLFQRTVVEDPIRAGAELTRFLKNGARVQKKSDRGVDVSGMEWVGAYGGHPGGWRVK